MSQSTDPDHFFQTTNSIEETNRKALKSKNNHGKPLKLPSKLLAITLDPTNNGRVFVAESAGTVRRVVLETGEKSHIYRGPTAPLTCVALSPDTRTVFAGCWDKTIWSWATDSRAARRKYTGHTDFVKTVLCLRIGAEDLLVSGGADASIIVWNVTTGAKLHTLKGHTRGIQALVVDAVASVPDASAATIFSAGSDREIRRWRIGLESAAEIEGTDPIIAHETSVYKVLFDADDDLWTASADGTVKCLVRDSGWKAETTLPHPDFARDVVVDERGGWVVTVCRDEEVRVWNRAAGELHHTFSGHYEEVTGLVLVGQMVVSVSIDATLRQWSLKPEDLQKAKVAQEEAEEGVVKEKQAPGKTPLVTEDEERELAELMDDNE
ncbi:WD40/YVTN repeat-like-containing domain [Lasallia pustulata]|uniref:WD40/YVTN repeat-like-containing domain n=1 Tax=Lasallia pustulata TaxID=136370 RepID=A0A1W5CU26_9LECA|nr:WD40/YVTN repeat-like-containing domain [Lasallia pustulata]